MGKTKINNVSFALLYMNTNTSIDFATIVNATIVYTDLIRKLYYIYSRFEDNDDHL